VEVYRGRSARLIPELPGLGSHEHVSQSLLGIRHKPTKRIRMKNLEFAKARCITVTLFEAAYRDPKEIMHD